MHPQRGGKFTTAFPPVGSEHQREQGEFQKKLLVVAPGTGQGTANNHRECGNTHFSFSLSSQTQSPSNPVMAAAEAPTGGPRSQKSEGGTPVLCSVPLESQEGKANSDFVFKHTIVF